MLNIEKNKDLTQFLTIKIGSVAEFFTRLKNLSDIREAIYFANKKKKEIFILGGGSNTLVSKRIKALVLKNEITGIKIVRESKNEVFIEALSGELWMKLVNFTVEKNLYGLENLASIYGTVGAAPVQNIGAYGAELKDVFYSLRAINLKTGKEKIFLLKDCHFAYRDSIFKNRLRGKYFIYSVILKLKKNGKLNSGYGFLADELKKQKISNPRPKDMANLVNKIRGEKLPNPGILPNAGSFFKNPEISLAQFKKLQLKYSDLPRFIASKSTKVMVPAAWLIERVGFKGKKFGDIGMFERQALIMVNYKQASAKDALNLVKKIKMAIKKEFGLDLETEVNII